MSVKTKSETTNKFDFENIVLVCDADWLIKSLLAIGKTNCSEVLIEFHPTVINFIFQDDSCITFGRFSLDKKDCTQYLFRVHQRILVLYSSFSKFLNLFHFNRKAIFAFSYISDTDQLNITYDYAQPQKTAIFACPLMSITDQKDQKWDDNFDVTLQMPLNDFDRIMDNIQSLSETVICKTEINSKTNLKKFVFEYTTEDSNGCHKVSAMGEGILFALAKNSEPLYTKFSSKILSNIAHVGLEKYSNVEIKCSNNFIMQITYKPAPNSRLVFAVAPKLD